MPSRAHLHAGDRIRILRVPAHDLVNCAHAMREGRPWAQSTVRVLQRLADRRQVVRIYEVDEYGNAWFASCFKNKRNVWEEHFLAIMEDDSWELFDSATTPAPNAGAPS